MKEWFKRFFVTVLISLMVCSTIVSAKTEDSTLGALSTSVYTALKDNYYSLADGGSIKGSKLFEKETGYDTKKAVYNIDESEYSRLSSSAKSQFISDICEESYAAQEEDSEIEDATIDRWWSILQQNNGVGSKFMTEILKNTNPDFVAANRIYQPFSGVVGTVLGLGCVLIIALLGIVMVCDIAYIVLPPVRLFHEDSQGGGQGGQQGGFGRITSHLFSDNAIKAVQICEGGGQGGGSQSGQQPLAYYFKHQAFALIILGICLLYLVSGQLYTLVGWVLDLLNGFLGF